MVENKLEQYKLAIAIFLILLKSESKDLSIDDAQLLRKVMLSKSKPGIPNF